MSSLLSSVPEGLRGFCFWLENARYALSLETVICDVHDKYLESFRNLIEWIPSVPIIQSGRYVSAILGLLGLISKSSPIQNVPLEENRKLLLLIVCSAKFIGVVNGFLQTTILVEFSSNEIEEHFSSTLAFSKAVMNNLSFFEKKRLYSLVVGCLDLLKSRPIWSHRLINEFTSVKEKLDEVIKHVDVEEEASKMREFTGECEIMLHDRVPPDNFKKVQIIPTLVELLENKKPFLRPNKIKGAYQTPEHYLDVQFRLLREDFVQHLRNGVKHLRDNKEEYLKGNSVNVSEDNVKVYTGIVFSRRDKNDGTHLFRLPYQLINGVDWSNSKQLMAGCIVVLSSDFCNTAIFATAQDDPNSERDRKKDEKPPPKELSRGILRLKIEYGEKLVEANKQYIMLECETYFEAYRYNLSVLQKITFLTPEERNPMSKFIVAGCSSVNLPGYFEAGHLLQLPVLCSPQQKTELCSSEKYLLVPISNQNLDTWPTSQIKDGLQMDDDQYEAYLMALTSELAIIQGPPGTGKTFIGLQIVRTLLLNRGRQGSVPATPILIVCKTNHALDQFLELLLTVLENKVRIVRVGSQSKSIALKECSLYKQRSLKCFKSEQKQINYFNNLVVTKKKILLASTTPEEIEGQEKILQSAIQELQSAKEERDGKILNEAHVIGMTTTGAAKHHGVLEHAKPEIVIIDEAAEILEAHVITSLTSDCKHLILIGDHLQLRPSPAVYLLGFKYHMNVSFFERMILNGVKPCTLKTQHRMRPEISDLITGPVYDTLYNHPSVEDYPPVKGVVKSLFFVTHTEPEKLDNILMSKSNQHEADFIAGLCEYLLLQGYLPSEIAVLTAYNAQVFLLQKVMPASCREVQVVSVDSYQGEENKIILLSLVRSNPENEIGFVGIENRVCVALSRAKHGLFIIGNLNSFISVSNIWQQIHEKLKAGNNCGDGLELKCEEHGKITRVQRGSDFLSLNSGGGCVERCMETKGDKEKVCEKLFGCGHKTRVACWAFGKAKCKVKCTQKLKCGHECTLDCHLTSDPDHLTYKCNLECERCCKAGHECGSHFTHPCSETCPLEGKMS